MALKLRRQHHRQGTPLTHPIISEVAGRVSSGMEDGLSIRRQQDEITGLSTIQILDPSERPSAGKDLKPAITWWMKR